jgi:YD repeat-containing protein
LTQLFNLKSDDSLISSFAYQVDPAGNRTSVLEGDGVRVTWTYDRTNQLISERRSGANAYFHTFTYDEVGNRLTKVEDSAATTYAYDSANQLKTSVAAAGTTTYAFDANGNQQLVQEPAGTRTTWSWDFENQPTLVQLPTGARVSMAYNADSKRVDRIA